MAEARLKALGAGYGDNGNQSPSLIPRRRISHRHSHSTPHIFPLALPTPTLSYSTSSSRSTTESTLATPVNSVFNAFTVHTDDTEEEDLDNDHTPTPSPKAKARVPAAPLTTRYRSSSIMAAPLTRIGSRKATAVSSTPTSPALFRKLSVPRTTGRPGPSGPTLAMSHSRGNSHAARSPRVDSVPLILPPPMSSFSLPASPLHQATMLPNEERNLTRSEYLLKSALLKDQIQSPPSPAFSSNASSSRLHRRRHSHTTSVNFLHRNLHDNLNIFSTPSSPSLLPQGYPVSPAQLRRRPASPTRSAPLTPTTHSPKRPNTSPRPHPHSESYSHSLNHLPPTAGTRLLLTPHEQVLRARLEKVLSAGTASNARTPIDRGGSSSSDDSRERDDPEDWRRKLDRKRKRASAPATGYGFGFGYFGWLWKSPEEQDAVDDEVGQDRSQMDSSTSSNAADSNSHASPLRSSSPYRNSSPHVSPYGGRDFDRSTTPQGSPHTPSRLRAHTQPFPASPNRSPYGQGYQYSPRPKHAFSLGTATNVVESGLQRGEGGTGRMLTPPPTPPRESVFFGEAGTKGKVESPVDLGYSTYALGLRPVEDSLEPALMRKDSKTASSITGRKALGIGRPTRTRMGSEEDESLSRASASEEGSANDNTPTGAGAPERPSLSLLAPPFSGPTSAASVMSFNARTASEQCRQMDGYVSFASVEGLGEPPASALPTGDDANSLTGDKEYEEGAKRGWVGRLFRR